MFLLRNLILSVMTLFGLFAATAQNPQAPTNDPSRILSQAVGPFIQKNCQTCHNTGLPSGSVDMEQLLAAPNSLAEQHDTWQNIAYQIQSGRMPPESAPKPSKADADAALELISRALAANPWATGSPIADPKPEPATTDWLTFSYDAERTGWARGETRISKATARQLQLLWRLQTDTVPNPVNRYSTLTDAVVANNIPFRDGRKTVVFVGSHDNTIYAIDGDKGTVLWARKYPNTAPPPVAASGNCPNNMNATPVIDRQNGTVYFLPNDGKLRGVSIVSDGEDKFSTTSIVPPYSRNFSLNLVDGRIFTGTTRGCANAISQVVGIDVNSPDHPISHFYTSTGKGSGPWGRGGIVKTPFGVLAQTADGAYDPAGGRWGSSVVGLSKDGRLTDSFTPIDQEDLDARDLDLGSSSPVVFPFGGRTLVAVAAKEGRIYLLDAKNLGGKDHRTPLYTSPRWSNDIVQFSFNGMWSVMSTYLDAQGKRWLLAPFYGPAAKETAGLFRKSHGPTVNGVLMAFTVEGTGEHPTLQPQWMSADLDLPGVAVIANDVILILANGDRGSTLISGAPPRGGGRGNAAAGDDAAAAGGGRGGRGAAAGGQRALPIIEVNPAEPGFERDAAWRASQLRPFDQGGQQAGSRYSGGRDTTHAVLYALDAATGDEIYSSGTAMDSWNHYGGIAVSDGHIYVTTWDARVFAFGFKQ
jgi:outer membrane protein assembly factor BamB